MLPRCKNEGKGMKVMMFGMSGINTFIELLVSANTMFCASLFSFSFSLTEEKQQIRKAILSCSLTIGKREAFEDEAESEEDEDE